MQKDWGLIGFFILPESALHFVDLQLLSPCSHQSSVTWLKGIALYHHRLKYARGRKQQSQTLICSRQWQNKTLRLHWPILRAASYEGWKQNFISTAQHSCAQYKGLFSDIKILSRYNDDYEGDGDVETIQLYFNYTWNSYCAKPFLCGYLYIVIGRSCNTV